MNRKTFLRAALGLAAGSAIALAVPLSASAHVRIDPDQAAAGGYSYVTFRVPTESDTASTVGLEVELPTTTPFTSVSYQAVPGWTTTVTRATLPKPVTIKGTVVTEAPTKIVWTADSAAAGIQPGQFGLFTVSLGIVPDTGSVRLPAIQSYSDGSVVSWNEATPADGTEPQHPAPTLYINDAPPSAGGDVVSEVSSSPAPNASASSASTGGAGVALAVGLGLGGLVLGAIALVVSVFSATRRRAGR